MVVAALLLGLAAPALADIQPENPKPEPAPEVETPPPTETKTEAPADAKTDAKSDAKSDAKAETKSGSCSVADGDRNLFVLAASVLLISGAALRRRRS